MPAVGVVLVVTLLAACGSSGSSDDADGGGTSTSAAADTAATTDTTDGADGGADATSDLVHGTVETLAADDLAGRQDRTAGSAETQDYLIGQLQDIAEPLDGDATDADAYRAEFDEGTNVLAVIPGTELTDEYVVVGAHYDHLGHDCDGVSAADDICNGATDNATGVAAALAVAQTIASRDDGPRRSVILAFWDREEDDLGGSKAFVADPPVPLDAIVGYVNFDIQGTNLSPALADSTVMVGAETGGPNLVASARAATTASSLDTVALSLLFGQGRSDHAAFAAAGVPVVFFTDANPPCYHTVGDDVSIVDFPKLDQQILTAQALVDDLAGTDEVPEFVPDTPAAAYDDAVSMHDIISRAEPDFGRFSAPDQATAEQFLADLETIVDAGPEAFDDDAVGVLLQGSVALVRALSTGECDGFLD